MQITNFLQSINDKIDFELVKNLVIEAETQYSNFQEKKGAEKKKYVVNKLTELIDIPYIPNFLETGIEKIIYSAIIDAIIYIYKQTLGEVPTDL